jgi:hypothetical protein
MTGVHRLQHVERLAPSDLADDDPIRPHPKRVADQIAHRHLAAAFHVRRTCFEGDDMRIRQTQLRRILDRDHPLVVADRRGEDPEHRRLAAAGATGHDHVGAPPNARQEEAHHPWADRRALDQELRRDGCGRELADRERGTAEREGRHDRVDPRTVR